MSIMASRTRMQLDESKIGQDPDILTDVLEVPFGQLGQHGN